MWGLLGRLIPRPRPAFHHLQYRSFFLFLHGSGVGSISWLVRRGCGRATTCELYAKIIAELELLQLALNEIHKFCFQHWSRGRGTCGTGSGAPARESLRMRSGQCHCLVPCLYYVASSCMLSIYSYCLPSKVTSKLHRVRLMKVISGNQPAASILEGQDPYVTLTTTAGVNK